MARDLGRDGFKKFFSACFAAGTRITDGTGWMAIEEVATGDKIWSRSQDGPDHPAGYRTVELTMRRSSPIVELHAGGQIIRTTVEHPFWVRERGWIATQHLRPGDELAGKEGEWTRVSAIEETNEYVNVYNIQISEYHTYFVGDEGWDFAIWAHNADGDCTIPGNRSKENAPKNGGIVAQNGTKINGFTKHGIDRAIGDTAQRAGTKPETILDALKNPKKITSGVDSQGRPFEIFTGQNARVVVNPQTGQIVSVNPLSGAGASR